MKKKMLLLAAFMLSLTLLVACADHTVTATDYLDAINAGDVERAADLVCAEQADEIENGIFAVPEEDRETAEFQNVSCSQRSGDEVECRYTIVQNDTSLSTEGTPIEVTRNVVFDIENGRICGFSEEALN